MCAEMRRETRQKQDKISHQMDSKIRNIDETRKGAELQIEVLTRTNAELISRQVLCLSIRIHIYIGHTRMHRYCNVCATFRIVDGELCLLYSAD